MKAASRVDEHHVGTVGLGRGDGVESHRRRVGTHLLLDHGHAHTFAPDADLLHGGGTEGVGGTKIDLLAGFLKLVCELSNGCGLAHAVHADDKDDVRSVVGGQLPIVVVGGVVL